jgi:transcriptional regulator of aromatic amino acid metabolism
VQSIRDPSVAVRLMAGTTVSIRDRIADGAFSERLFYRLNIIHVLKDVPTPSNAARGNSVWPSCHELASVSPKGGHDT